MHEPDFWSQSAEAMEQTIEGRRLIALEIADVASKLWHEMLRWCEGLIHRLDGRRQLPPL
jgi:hypothetical protein